MLSKHNFSVSPALARVTLGRTFVVPARDNLYLTWLLGTFVMTFAAVFFHAPWPIWIILMCLGCQTPVTAIFFLTLTQIVLIDAVPLLTGTQSFVVIWSIWNVLAMVRLEVFPALWRVMIFMLPLLGWFALTGVTHGNQGKTIILLNATVTAIIALVEWRRVQGEQRYLIALAIALASMMAVFPFWLMKVGIDFGGASDLIKEAMRTKAKSIRGGVERFAATGVNFNYAGLCMNIGTTIFFSFLLYSWGRERSFLKRFSRWVHVVPIVFSVPATLATLSRAAVLGIGMSLASPIFVHQLGAHSRKITMYLGIGLISLCGIAIIGGLIWTVAGSDVTMSVEAMTDFEGSTDVKSARGVQFQRGFDALTGARGSPIYGNFKETGGSTHNVFLEGACFGGIPGFLMHAFVLLYPLGYFLFRRNAPKELEVFLAVYLVIMVSGITLENGNFKILWSVWAFLVEGCHSSRVGSRPTLRSLD